MDFEDRLLDTIKIFNVGFPIYTDVNSSQSSISVVMLPGSRTVQEYFDGKKDKEYLYEMQIKASTSERNEATSALAEIGAKLDDVDAINSNNNSYEFNDVQVTNEIYYSDVTDDGWIYFRLQIKAFLTIEKER